MVTAKPMSDLSLCACVWLPSPRVRQSSFDAELHLGQSGNEAGDPDVLNVIAYKPIKESSLLTLEQY